MSINSECSVLNFYRGSTVLLAGGTGFMGKVLLEKVLRCLEVKKLYLLIRRKRGVCGKDRLQQILRNRLFDQVRTAELIAKIEPVEVDYDKEDFGLSPEITTRIKTEIKIVFYCIATVKFNVPIAEALRTNVGIGRNMMNWCKTAQNLEAFVFTSTFYSNSNRRLVEEKVYDDISEDIYENCIKLLNCHLSVGEENKMTKEVLKCYENTYFFSKKCAEIMIQREFSGKVPIGIYRPPIVLPTCREPVVGWTDNYHGITPYVIANLGGVNKISLMRPELEGDFAPVDYCVNAMMVCAYDIALRKQVSGSQIIPVFNHCGTVNRCRYGDILRFIADSRQWWFERWIWKYCWITTSNRFVLNATYILLYAIAALRDFIVGSFGNADKINRYHYRRAVKQVIAVNQTAGFILLRKWRSESNNMRQLERLLSHAEEKIMGFDLSDIQWAEYVKNSVGGVVQFLKR
ncbi:fatty acyl-CoA reductase wat-like [Malaya genurostris]|uniref:fatty acyl-CoA reductase wat-like n=1 Tax=Malaya genurostris TaxID=325434 RepID=UPI0026F3CF4B|nr:fatty acyl-CoA reductase wat-like [Malaya genurostris]